MTDYTRMPDWEVPQNHGRDLQHENELVEKFVQAAHSAGITHIETIEAHEEDGFIIDMPSIIERVNQILAGRNQ